jgi:iron complex transport system ATP-binding protein
MRAAAEKNRISVVATPASPEHSASGRGRRRRRSYALEQSFPAAARAAIEVAGVSVVRGTRNILRGIDWSVPSGVCAAILGPNGSGKSTLVRVIMGQMWPTRGHVRVLGQPFGETDLHELRKSIRLVQASSTVEFDPEETTLGVVLTGFFGTFGLFNATTPAMQRRAKALIRQVGLHKQMQQRYQTLSSGERMRCLIARALVVCPRLLILDEPTAGLDLLAREQVLGTLHQLFTKQSNPPTILMITHHVEELLPETSEVLVLENGRGAASGTPAKVLTSKLLSEVYDCPVNVTRSGRRYWLRVKPAAWEKVNRSSANQNRGNDGKR